MDSISTKIKEQLKLSMPSALENVIITLISITDTFFISRLGSEAISAVGAMVSIIFFINLGMKSIQVSNNVIVAQDLGANQREKIKIITGNAILLSTIIQIISIVITIMLSPIIPSVFKVSNICLTYLYIRLIGIIPAGIGMVVSGYQRVLAKSKFIMNIRFLSLILNIILDYIAIKMNYGIAGVAWATVITEVINTTILVFYSRKQITYKINRNYINELLNLAKFGILSRIFDRGGKLVLNIILSRIGMYEYAAHVIVNRIEDFANDFCYGFGIGITTKIGIAIGRANNENYKVLRKAINRIILLFSIVLPLMMLIVLLVLLPNLLIEEQSLKVGYELVPLLLIYSFLLPIHYKYSSIIEGMKEFKFNSKLSAITNTLKIILSYILCKFIGIKGFWTTFIIITIITIIILKRKEGFYIEEKHK